MALHPAPDVEVFLSDGNVDLVEAGIDVALRMGDLQDSSLTARRIGRGPRIVVAAPSYFGRRGSRDRVAKSAAKQPIEIANIKTFFSSQAIDIAHCRGFSYCVPDTGGWWSSAQEPIPVSRNINGDDALGVDVLVRIGSDVHDVMIWINLRRSRSNLTDPGRVPRHDDVREQCQTGRDRGHLLRRAAVPCADRPGIDRALQGGDRLALAEQRVVHPAEGGIAEIGTQKAGEQQPAECVPCLKRVIAPWLVDRNAEGPARSMLYRKPATLRRMRSEHKVLEIACFLLQLLRLTDDGLGMIDYRIADLGVRPGPAPRQRWKTDFAGIKRSSCNWQCLPMTRASLTPPCAIRSAPC
jgi:hypothetical protein